MALDSIKNLEQRANDNHRGIDEQWITENEANEFYNLSFGANEAEKPSMSPTDFYSLGLEHMDIDSDIHESINDVVNSNDKVSYEKPKHSLDKDKELKELFDELYSLLDEGYHEENSNGRSK